jgi:hypothetical protein
LQFLLFLELSIIKYQPTIISTTTQKDMLFRIGTSKLILDQILKKSGLFSTRSLHNTLNQLISWGHWPLHKMGITPNIIMICIDMEGGDNSRNSSVLSRTFFQGGRYYLLALVRKKNE